MLLYWFFILMEIARAEVKEEVSDEQLFNPLRSSLPISYPIRKLEDLISRTYFDSFHYPFNKASIPLSTPSLPARPRVMVCHDMAGGYKDDRWVQGASNADAYSIWHWYLMDIFVYFSHNLVTIPPPCWTNAAHTHGVKVLGTFITEGSEGRAICDVLLSSEVVAHSCAERLAEIAFSLGFDGWLIDMEVELDLAQISVLKDFLCCLTETMHSFVEGSLIIWYDSVTEAGNITYQNQLNQYNKPFFDLCDGLFSNYWWKEDFVELSAAFASERKLDVYMGIDVFGRGTYSGGGWSTSVALHSLKEHGVSAAIFAPGWVYETKQGPDFNTAQNCWWGLVRESWGVQQVYPSVLPFYTNFDQGHGLHIFSDGFKLSSDPWSNISLQSYQPLLDGSATRANLDAFVDLKSMPYDGGSSIKFEGMPETDAIYLVPIFQAEVPLLHSPIYVTYSVKMDRNSFLSLSLGFLKAGKRIRVLFVPENLKLPLEKYIGDNPDITVTLVEIASFGNIIPKADKWFLQHACINMDGCLLVDIEALCCSFNSGPFVSLNNSPDDIIKPYSASLGHISIKNCDENIAFPPATSWDIFSQFIEWGSDSQGSRTVSLKLLWDLRLSSSSTSAFNFSDFRIFNRTSMHAGWKFLGVAKIKAFYVAQLFVPVGVSEIVFAIQVRGHDGSTQKLEDCPKFCLPCSR